MPVATLNGDLSWRSASEGYSKTRFLLRITRIMFKLIRPALALLILGPLALIPFARADDDHRIARELLKAGEIVSLERLLEEVKSSYPGHILKIKLDDDDDAETGWVYETKILRDDGVVVKIEYDAKSLKVLEVEEGKKKHRKKKDRGSR